MRWGPIASSPVARRRFLSIGYYKLLHSLMLERRAVVVVLKKPETKPSESV
jgi:hypothetical protein